jgi:signal transduction histidine kinase
MIDSETTAQQLAVLLDQHREGLASSWIERIDAIPDSSYRRVTLEQVQASTTQLVSAIVERLRTGDSAALRACIQELSLARARTGFEVADVVEALLLGKEVAQAMLCQTHPGLPPDRLLSFGWEIDACLRGAVCEFTESFAAQASQLLRDKQERTVLILELLQAASSTLELDEVLRRVAEGIAAAAGVRYCHFYLLDERGLLVPHSGTHAVPSQAAQQYFLGWTIDPGANAFTREVLERKQPVACFDLEADPRIDQEATRAMGVKSVLAVPFVVRDRAVAMAIASTYDVHHEFTSEQIELAWGMANAVALVIDNARLHKQVRSLAVLQERERLAREMHDRLAQTLAYLNVKTSVVEAMLSSGENDQVRSSLSEMQETVRQAYTDVRGTIFGLRLAAQTGLGLIPTLRACVAHFESQYGLPARFILGQASLPDLPAEAELQIVRIVQEALTNTYKHAKALQAWVRLQVDGDVLAIRIEDDGQGFDPASANCSSSQTCGLQVMHERAQGIGGSLAIHSTPGEGTQVLLCVPLRPGEDVR